MKEPSTFESREIEYSATIPSMTICPRQKNPDNFVSIEDVVKAIDELKVGSFFGFIKTEGKGSGSRYWDLTNSEVLSNEFNATLNDVWSYTPIIEPTFQNGIIICATMNVPNIEPPKQGYYIVSD